VLGIFLLLLFDGFCYVTQYSVYKMTTSTVQSYKRRQNYSCITEVASLIGIGPVLDTILCWCGSICGHIAWLSIRHVGSLSSAVPYWLGHHSDLSWKHFSGRLRSRCLDHLHRYNNTLLIVSWRRAVSHAHMEVKLQSIWTASWQWWLLKTVLMLPRGDGDAVVIGHTPEKAFIIFCTYGYSVCK